MPIILSAKDLVVGYSFLKPVVSGVHLELEEGKSYALTGGNGAGKTTLFKTLLGLLRPLSGTVQRHSQVPLSYVPQAKRLQLQFPLTAKEVLKMPFFRNFPWRSSIEQSDSWSFLLHRSGLETILHKQISECSGGELQKILIVRALLAEPKLLFLDEPMDALDPQARKGFQELLDSIQKERQMTLFFISHNLEQDWNRDFSNIFEIQSGKLSSKRQPASLGNFPTHSQ